MQIKNSIAISCDHCGSICKDNFIYYSFDFKEIDFKNNTPSSILLSLDICDKCTEKYLASILNNNSKNNTNRLICEINGDPIISNYYSVSIAKVKVSSERLRTICKNCNKQYDNKICQCGSENFVNIPDVLTDEQFLNINICENEFNKFKTKFIEFKTLLSNLLAS